MAKRKKKLNKKLVAALSAVTVLILSMIAAGLYIKRDFFFPKDPVPYAKAGLDALEKKQYKLASDKMTIAVRSVRGKDPESRKSRAKYLYDLGRIHLEWFKNGKELTDSEKRKSLQKCLGAMQQAAALDRTYLDPRKTLYDVHWQFAYAQLQNRRSNVHWDQFIESATSLLEVDPKIAMAYYRRGIALGSKAEQTADKKDWSRGLADFRKAIEIEKDSVRFWGAWLRLLIWTESREPKTDVAAGFQQAFKASPNSAALRILYASYLRRKDRSDEAEEQLREAIKCEPTSPNGHLSMARFLSQSEQYDAAFKELKAAEELDETLADIYLQRSTIFRVKKDLGKSVKALQRGVAVLAPKLSASAATQPKSRQSRILTEQMNRLNFALANTALDHRHTSKDKKQQAAMEELAKASFEKLDGLSKNSPHRAKLAGRLALIRKDAKEAIANLEQAYRAFGMRDLQTPALLITLYDSVGMPGKAEKLLTSLQNAPRLQDSVEVILALARLKMRYRDYEAADNFVNRALRAEPQNKTAHQLKGELRLLMGKSVTVSQVGSLSAGGVRTIVEQAELKWIEGNKREALALLTGLRKALPKNLLLAERAINMHLLLGEKDKAGVIVKEMLAAYPKNEELKFQADLLDKTPDERFALQMARVEEKITDPFVRTWAKARMASRAGKQDLFKKFLAKAVAMKPDDPGITAVQFRSAVKEQNWDAALAVVKRVTKTNELRGKSMHADMLVRKKEHAKAIELLAPLRKSYPDSKFILRMLGECYLATKQIDLAADVFGVLESNDPGDISALIGLAIVTQRQGRIAENEGYVTRAYRRPAARTHPYISRRYLEIRESKATGDEIKKIIARREELHKAGPSSPNYLENLARLARLCEYRTRDLSRAAALYNEAYQKTGRSLEWGRNLAFFYARNGEAIKGEGVVKTGISAAKTTGEKVAWLVMHGEFLTMYSPEQALRAYNRASVVDPGNPMPFKAKAELYAKAGRWPKAIENMIAYVAKRKEDIRGQKTLIQYRINGRQYDEAEKSLEEILARNPTDAQALLLKAVLLRLRGSPAKAIVVATKAIEKHPEFAAAFSVRARAYLVMGELGMAKNDLESARTLSRTPEVSMELADIYSRLGREPDAILVLKSLVAENKTYEAALHKLISMYLQSKSWSGAESSLAQAHKLYPNQPTYWMIEAKMWQSRKQPARAIAALENVYRLGKNSMPAVRAYLLGLMEANAYDRAFKVAIAYKDKPLWSAWVQAVLGRIMVVKKQESKGSALFLQSVQNARTDELSFVVSQIRSAYGSSKAIERMVAWSKARIDNWYIQVLLGDLCSAAVTDPGEKITAAQRNRYLQLAIDSYNEAIGKARKPEDVAMLSNRLGKVYYDKGETKKSEQSYMRCLKIAPNNNAALNNLAYLYVEDLNEPEKALPYVRKVIRLRPQDPNVLDTYGWVLGKLERYDEAKKYLQRSIERDAELAAPRYHLGWVFEKTGDPKRAMKHYRLGMEMVRNKPYTPLQKLLQGALKRLGA